MKKQIIITIEGGVIQAIDDIPEDVKVVVMDFDCNETRVGKSVRKNADGDFYWLSEWEKE